MKALTSTIAAAILWVAATPAPAFAAAQDYVFEPVTAEVGNGPGSEIAVRLTRRPTGTLVAGAIIFRTRLDMSPDNMERMTANLEPAISTEPGTYTFRADFTMAGNWALKLQAKVNGEPETVESTVIFQVGN